MPEISSHPSGQTLTLFGHGKLPEAQAAKVAAHLASCAVCRQAVAGLPPESVRGKGRAAKPGGTLLAPGGQGPDALRAAVPGPAAEVPPELADHPKFRIVRELGRGGMGVIYLAEHRAMEKPVALKVISPAVLNNPGALARFQAEVRAAGKLDHPNIARAHDADQAGELHFLVMEYVEGLSLAQVLQKKGPLPIANACHYVRQAALGLQHASERDMVHRDIKPQNLMLTPKGQVKVLDFGLARLHSAQVPGKGLTQADSFMGTPEYVAPEQATDARTADIRADIYSLGCTLYALLTGRPPFVEDTVVKLVMAQIGKEPQPLHELRPDVPAELSAVVAKMLAKDPAQRYQRPIEVAQALAPFIKAAARPAPFGGVPVPPGVARPGTGTIVGGATSREKALLGPGTANPPSQQATSEAEKEMSRGGEVDNASPSRPQPHPAPLPLSPDAGTKKTAALAGAKRLLSLPWLIGLFVLGFLPWSEVSCATKDFHWQAGQSGYQALYGGISSPFDSLEAAAGEAALKEARTNKPALSKNLETEHAGYFAASSPFLVLFWALALVLLPCVCLTPLGKSRLRVCLLLAGLMTAMLVTTLIMGTPLERRIDGALPDAISTDADTGLMMIPAHSSGKTLWFWLALGAVLLVGATEGASNLLWNTLKSVRPIVLAGLAGGAALLVTAGVGTQFVLWEVGLTGVESRLAQLHHAEQEAAAHKARQEERARKEQQERDDAKREQDRRELAAKEAREKALAEEKLQQQKRDAEERARQAKARQDELARQAKQRADEAERLRLAEIQKEAERKTDLEKRGLAYYPKPTTLHEGKNAEQWYALVLSPPNPAVEKQAVAALEVLKEEGMQFLLKNLVEKAKTKKGVAKVLTHITPEYVHPNDLPKIVDCLDWKRAEDPTRMVALGYLRKRKEAKAHIELIEAKVADLLMNGKFRADVKAALEAIRAAQ